MKDEQDVSLSFEIPAIAESLQLNLITNLRRTYPHLLFTLGKQLIRLSHASVVTSSDKESVGAFIESYLKGLGPLQTRAKNAILYAYNPKGAQQSHTNEESYVLATDISGVYVIPEQAQQICLKLDALFSKFLRSLGAVEVSMPSLVSEALLTKAGCLPRDEENIHKISGSDLYLTPALCLGCYPVWKGLKSQIVSCLGSVYRTEGGVFDGRSPLARLREYRVRETILVMEPKDLDLAFSKTQKFLQLLAETFELPVDLVSASDMFIHPEAGKLAVSQLLKKSKYEFRFLGSDEPCSLFSWNYHERHFVESFKMAKDDDAKIESACMGFGLERWTRALLLTLGNVEVILERSSNLIDQMEVDYE
jgi:hypothetical protein